MREQEEGLILIPFKTRRYEKMNDNGEEKQIELEKKRLEFNERVKER
jgi:hypothetical protein